MPIVDEVKPRDVTENRAVEFRFITGAPRTGKTSLARHMYPNALLIGHHSANFIGNCMDRATALLLDDFTGYGPGFITPTVLYQLVTGAPRRWQRAVPTETTHIAVVITSNLTFDQLYNGWKGVSPSLKEGIRSQISEMIFL